MLGDSGHPCHYFCVLALPLAVTIVATAAVSGTPEPCGCNSDPLGDVARVATLAKGALWVDAGSLSYDPELSAQAKSQAAATAAELARIYAGADVGLGDADLKYGSKISPARQACNARGLSTVAPRVRVVGGVKLGVFGVVSPEILKAHHLQATDAVAAAKKAIRALHINGAQAVVMLAGGMTRVETRQLLKQLSGVTFAVVGAGLEDGMAEPEQVGDAWMVAPQEKLQRVVKLTLNVSDAGKPIPLYAGDAARTLERDRADKRIAALQAQLKEWLVDPAADQSFVGARKKELEELRAQRKALDEKVAPPPTGNWFSYELVPVRHVIARDENVAASLKRLAKAIGDENFKLAQNEPPPPAENDQPHFVGTQACAKCHQPAVDFWKTTVHAQAWKTLVDVDKQYHYDCIGCHVTGFAKAGGSSLGSAEKQKLVDVQCEVCHGPGSKHVDEAGLDDPRTITRKPPDNFCADNCHTKEHSDTFTLVPYLRDILGKGHAEKARKALGNGPTGHEIRSKALSAAGR
jgi:hypothetical protein